MGNFLGDLLGHLLGYRVTFLIRHLLANLSLFRKDFSTHKKMYKKKSPRAVFSSEPDREPANGKKELKYLRREVEVEVTSIHCLSGTGLHRSWGTWKGTFLQ